MDEVKKTVTLCALLIDIEGYEEELADPILSDIDPHDPVARNPCLRRGPLSWDYWTRLQGQWLKRVQGVHR